MSITFSPLEPCDVEAVVALQPLAFPAPFDQELLWQASHIYRHLELFPQAQWVAKAASGAVVGSCSNTRIDEATWQAHGGWDATVGGPFLDTFCPAGSTLYGLDISVHPDFRRQGIGRRFYDLRRQFVIEHRLARYGTACRMPHFHRQSTYDPLGYAHAVARGERVDPTLTPLLRYNLRLVTVLTDYMQDAESGNAAALLEWSPLESSLLESDLGAP